MNDNSMSLSITMVNFSWIRSLAALAVIASQAGAWAAPLPPCPAALQSQAHTSLESLNQQQAKEDQELRRQPSSNYATMNGPVIRELAPTNNTTAACRVPTSPAEGRDDHRFRQDVGPATVGGGGGPAATSLCQVESLRYG